VVKLLEHEGIGGQIRHLDGAVVEAFERFTQDVVGLALQRVELLDRIDLSYQRYRGQQFFAV